MGMVEQTCGKNKIQVSFECETLKADKAAEDHIRRFMPKLAGLDAVGNSHTLSLSLSPSAPTPPPPIIDCLKKARFPKGCKSFRGTPLQILFFFFIGN